MPGMGSGINANNPLVVAAFHAALRHQALVVLAIALLVLVGGNVVRALAVRQAATSGDVNVATVVAAGENVGLGRSEPTARRLLRFAFGGLWILDGLLQGQSAMPLGMMPQVVKPAASTSPVWVQHLVEVAGHVWAFHPVTAATSAVWIQIGIGVALIVAPRGLWSRVAGGASVGWGLVVWVFGEAFGGIFAPGASWEFGVPGAVIFYCLAGALLALPERAWSTPRLGRAVLRVVGAFFLGMALLQAWPGRGFWIGNGPDAQLASMATSMASTPQPHLFSSWVSAFAGFATAHGFAANLFVVAALAVVGAGLLAARRLPAALALAGGGLLCVADWVLIQDFGFFGGVGTDPNSMIPMLLVIAAGYVALTRVPATATNVVALGAGPGASSSWDQLALRPAYAFRAAAAAGAFGVMLVGAAPVAIASVNPHASTILALAQDGTVQPTDQPTPQFRLVDQSGRTVTLASLRGKAVALTFLDPVCTSDCPIVAQEFRQAGQLLGREDRHVELVAIDANPRYTARAYPAAFTAQEGMGKVPNWRYLTGSLPQLQRLWKAFGVAVSYEPGGAMIGHSEIAYVIGPTGTTRAILNADPGQGSTATMSSFAVTLASTITKVLHHS